MTTELPLIETRLFDFNEVIKDGKLISRLTQLTLNPTSGMNQEVSSLIRLSKKRRVNASVIVAKHNEIIIAWALVSMEASNFNFPTGFEFNIGSGVLFEVFVHGDYRRMGIATRLIKRAKNISNGRDICVVPWDNASSEKALAR
jgi:GNAT superfamily N-acetyltransferase